MMSEAWVLMEINDREGLTSSKSKLVPNNGELYHLGVKTLLEVDLDGME